VQARQQFIVEESPELLQTQSRRSAAPPTKKTIVSLPLANRNFSQILALSPGAVVEVPDAGAFGKNTQNVSVNGAKNHGQQFPVRRNRC